MYSTFEYIIVCIYCSVFLEIGRLLGVKCKIWLKVSMDKIHYWGFCSLFCAIWFDQIWRGCNCTFNTLMITNPHRLRAVSVWASTGLVWRWKGCRLADDHCVHAGGVSGRGWWGGWEQQVRLGLLTQTIVIQRPRRVCILQGLRVLILRIRQQWAFCTT